MANFVENLKIRKLKCPKIKEEVFKVVNFSSDDCEHVNLEFLRYLTKLKTFSIEFNPGVLKKNYERRLFDVAVVDIENLSDALRELKNLEKLEIINSNLRENEKIQNILSSIENLKNLTTLILTNCGIASGKSGESFDQFLTKSESIKSIELKNNDFNYEFCVYFSIGILSTKANLDYLGLSNLIQFYSMDFHLSWIAFARRTMLVT